MANKIRISYAGRQVTFYKKNKRLDIYFPSGMGLLGKNFGMNKHFKARHIRQIIKLLTLPYATLEKQWFKNKL